MSKVRIQDDLYHYVNGDWLASAVIPDDKPTAGGFAELNKEVEKKLMADFAAMSAGNKAIPDIIGFKDALKIYQKMLDVQKRDSDGIKPLLPTLDIISNIKDISDLNSKAKQLFEAGLELPIIISVEPDMKDARHHILYLKGPDIILPDTSYYKENKEAGKALLEVYKSMALQALDYTTLNEKEKLSFIDDCLNYDELISKEVKSQVEWADYVDDYHPCPLDEVNEQLKPFDLKKLLKNIYGDKAPDMINVMDLKAIKNFNNYFNENNFKLYIHWLYVKTLLSALAYLSEDLATIGSIYRKALLGIEKEPELTKRAYQLASGLYSEPIGVYYGRTYFGEEAKKDVIDLVKQIIETYKKRIHNNQFLQTSTKEKAILKLSTMNIKMGYPDDILPYYADLKINDEDSCYESISKIETYLIKYNLNKLYKEVDKKEWAMPGHLVNACYDPFNNDITFPAAILQKPFYSLTQSRSANLGGIGAVIGHEISHAFDNNGAHFDEYGNLANWWSEEDFKQFDKKTKEMIAQFNGIPFHGGRVNGELVVSENIADNGGMASTLEIMAGLKDANYEEYFENWARIWCQKAREEYIQLLLSNDVHSPTELRANIVPRNFQEWYETYHVTASDGMYLPEDKRIIIW